MKPRQSYRAISDQKEVEIAFLNKKIMLFGWGRLITCLLTAFIVWFTWPSTLSTVTTGVLGSMIFLFFVRRHVDLKEQRDHYQRIKSYADFELSFLSGKSKTTDSGAEFIDATHPYSSDLDIFGENSVFQYLNRTKSRWGKEMLAKELRHVQVDRFKIERRQTIISEFAKNPEFIFSFLSFIEVANLTSLKARNNTEKIKPYSSVVLVITTMVLPAIALVLTLLFSFDLMPWAVYFQIVLVIGIPVLIQLKRNMSDFRHYEERLKLASSIDHGLNQLREYAPVSSEVKKLFEEINLAESKLALQSLKKINGAIDSRNNIIVGIILNFLLLWDFQCHKRLADWDKRWADKFNHWMAFSAQMEMILSMSLYVHNHSNFRYPTFSDQARFDLQGARHIQLQKDGIPNNFSLEGSSKFMIVTGANMAGKSTFLRTIGTNLLLAMKGLPVPVESMTFKPTRLFTSMVTADNLGEGESYFFSELKRLKQLTSILEEDEPLFVILDEILKGTNSLDKAEGSRMFMEKLLDLPAHGLIATHDLSLCELETTYPKSVNNYSFEVEFKEANLHFDYRLRRGICKNMNARFLLESMGLTKTS